MEKAFKEFRSIIRINLEISHCDLSDNDIRQLFLIAYLSGQKEAILNPLL